MLYVNAETTVDFWWVKPQSEAPLKLDTNLLNKHDSGPSKNTPGNSKAMYTPLAATFGGEGSYGGKGLSSGKYFFGVDEESGRAYIAEQEGINLGRMLIYFVWQ